MSSEKCPNDTNGDGDCGRPTCAGCYPEHQPIGEPAQDIAAAMGIDLDGAVRILGEAIAGMVVHDPEQLAAFMRGESNDPGVVRAPRGGVRWPTAPDERS